MNKLKDYIESKREKSRIQDEENIRSDFKVVERGGFLWLTHNGTAFVKLAQECDAKSITEALTTARDTAVEYERL